MLKHSLAVLLLWAPVILAQDNGRAIPTIDELIAIRTIRGATISPDGNWVAYTVRQADFEQDAYVNHIWLVDTETEESFQLTRGKKSAGNPKWSPDSKWLAFTSSRNEEKRQIHVISPLGGEASQFTKSKTGVGGFEWSPDGRRIVFLSQDAEEGDVKKRKEHVGDYFVVRKEYRNNHLRVFDVNEAFMGPVPGEKISEGEEHNVGGFSWSNSGRQIAFAATVNPDRINFHTSDLFVYSFDDSATKKIVATPGPDWNPQWSPDDRQILFSTHSGKELFYAFNSNFAVMPSTGGSSHLLTERFDENPRFADWLKSGIYFSALRKTNSHLFKLEPGSGRIEQVTQPENLMALSFSLTSDGRRVAFTAGSPTTLSEVYISPVDNFSTKKLTDMTARTDAFLLGSRELISWKSKDGAEIEGVLIKPIDFDPNRQHPLLCVIHGGPTGIDRPGLLMKGTRYYPVDQWSARGALILLVNYRGSAGYGEKFRRLNHRNLGVGDAWDVISGVDYLIDKGWVDRKRVGCMGWSQGGYIAAFLTTSSDRFAAISVGAGISNWATYYYNTDITPFTINYLGDDPVDDPKIYAKTSPMAYIKKASTPTLIQHGEFDKRVPTPNAYELRQGLEDRGVPVEMIVYKGFGHGINKPKSQRAVMWHNLKWFNHYLWGDELPDLARPDIPEEIASKEGT